ncbi:hypothetical protein RCO28_36975, partial [Streptomyces sp. LHD-70]|uniref:hypothetical protein n=1 Tax=Streptomyces sp. LHD-70 TaxID=3072140 RepID=UPI00280C5032
QHQDRGSRPAMKPGTPAPELFAITREGVPVKHVITPDVSGNRNKGRHHHPRISRHQHLYDATTGLTQPWNSGVVEGHVNRIKTLKRQMFGRAGFEPLCKRVLLV